MITIKFCTCHDSTAVMACAKIYSDLTKEWCGNQHVLIILDLNFAWKIISKTGPRPAPIQQTSCNTVVNHDNMIAQSPWNIMAELDMGSLGWRPVGAKIPMIYANFKSLRLDVCAEDLSLDVFYIDRCSYYFLPTYPIVTGLSWFQCSRKSSDMSDISDG